MFSRLKRALNSDAIQRKIEDALRSAGLMSSAQRSEPAQTAERTLAPEGLASQPGYRSPSPGDAIFARARRGPDEVPRLTGSFETRSFANHAGARRYQLYVPSIHGANGGRNVSLIVMLHGCTQTPEDFALGTRMNELAELHGFLVAYPEQTAKANGSRCWNWFRPEDQSRDDGEPAILAGITRDIVANFRVDERRVFVAGLSAGAAMAVVLANTYPELYAGIGVHSGLPYRAARDVPSAFAVMKQGSAQGARQAHVERAGDRRRIVPMIVFHGEQDRTVAPKNGADLVEEALSLDPECKLLHTSTVGDAHSGSLRSVYGSARAAPKIEHWLVRGGGHAWFGGSASGSHTERNGPDASAEMLRFFAEQR